MDINTNILMNKYSIYFGDTLGGGGHPNAARLVCEGRDLARSPQFDTFKEGHVVPVLSPTDWLMTEQPLPLCPFPIIAPPPAPHPHTMGKKSTNRQKKNQHFCIFQFSTFPLF